MTQSPKLQFFNGFRNEKQNKTIPTNLTSNEPSNVQGWLMNVPTYTDPEDTLSTIVDEDNNRIPIESPRKHKRPASIASEDSVNLDELINANFTTDMDDETDLPDLAALDLDDSTDEFWKLDNVESFGNMDTSFETFLPPKPISNNYDMNWNPTDSIKSTIPVTVSSDLNPRLRRSGSISSENSLNSQSTITQYAKYGLAPVMHTSESSSTSSRSLSRLSNYSTASSTTTTGIPLPRTNPTSNSSGIPTPSRSYTLNNNHSNIQSNHHHFLHSNNTSHNDVNSKSKIGSTTRTQLAKRASHIPAPTSTFLSSSPTPQRTTSTTSSPGSSRLRVPTTTQKRLPQRASHIPTVRESIHRPNSPLQNHSGRASATPSRISMRSPTPGGPRNSLFPPKQQQTVQKSTQQDEKRTLSPSTVKSTGIRPPGTSIHVSNIRSPSRIGTLKRT